MTRAYAGIIMKDLRRWTGIVLMLASLVMAAMAPSTGWPNPMSFGSVPVGIVGLALAFWPSRRTGKVDPKH
jgi:hypothetical protein